MKIEFRKVPQTPKELEVEYNSVKIEGTFCKISQSLVKVDAVLLGNTDIDCCRCGIAEVIEVDEFSVYVLKVKKNGQLRTTFTKFGEMEDVCRYFYDYNF